MRAISIAFLTGLFILATAGPSSAETLGEVLKGRGCDTTGLDRGRLARRITSFASLDDAEVFTIAYYPDDGSGRLGDSLYIDLFNRSQRSWLSREIQRGGPEAEGREIFGGSVLGISRSRDFFYLNTHVDPSAGYTLILTADLRNFATIYGWPLAVFPDGLLIFQNSEVHFAPTHYAEVSVFDPRTKRSWLVYPRKPYEQVRLEHIAQVRAAYEKRGEEWFKAHNHHGNAELFDSFLRGEVAMNSPTRAVAFRIAYDNTDTWDYAEKLKFQRFGGLGLDLQAVAVGTRPMDGTFAMLYGWLRLIARNNLQSEFLELFKSTSAVQEMLHHALERPEAPQESWQKWFTSLDPRWQNREVWETMKKVLATPPETTDVICIVRNIDREDAVECRELLAGDYEKQFGDLPLEEVLTLERLKEVFGN